jgi:protein gp37
VTRARSKRSTPARHRRSAQLRLGAWSERELVVDNFAGGGGASTGIEAALGRPVDIAINHWSEALSVHERDLFHDEVDDAWIDQIFAVMQATPACTYQVLTKRPDRARSYLRDTSTPDRIAEQCDAIAAARGWCHANDDAPWPLSNVWLGVSVEDQATADERIPVLLDTPAAIRFVSYEPALGPVDFSSYLDCGYESGGPQGWIAPLDWIIVGGESGPRARPFDVAWARSVIAQARAAGAPVFVKQLGARPIESRVMNDYAREPVGERIETRPVALRDRKGGAIEEWPDDLRVREWPEARS